MEAFDVLPLTAEEFGSALKAGIGVIRAKISFNWKTEELEAYNNFILKEFSNYLNRKKVLINISFCIILPYPITPL